MTSERPWLQLQLSEWTGSVRVDLTDGIGGMRSGGRWLPGGPGARGLIMDLAQRLKSESNALEGADSAVSQELGRLRGEIVSGPVEAAWKQARTVGSGPILLFLAIDRSLSNFPWELVFARGSTPEGEVQLIRVVRDAEMDLLADSREPLRLLLVAPVEAALAQELKEKALGQDKIQVQSLVAGEQTVDWGLLKETLRGPNSPHILHFVGNAWFPEGQVDRLALQLGGRDTVQIGDLVEILPPTVQLVYLQCCDSATAPGTEWSLPDLATASTMISAAEQVGQRADAVIAHLWPVHPTHATQMAIAFYQRLLDWLGGQRDAADPDDPAGASQDWRDVVADAVHEAMRPQKPEAAGALLGLIPGILYLRGRGPRLHSPGRFKRLYVLYAPDDWQEVRGPIRELGRGGDEVYYPLPDEGVLAAEALQHQLRRIDQVHLFWSKHSAEHWRRVGWRTALEGEQAPSLVVHRLDGTPVVDLPQGAPTYAISGSKSPWLWGVAALGAGVALWLAVQGWDFGLVAVLSGMALWMAINLSRPSIVRARAGSWIRALGDFLTTATGVQIVAAYEAWLSRVFGPPKPPTQGKRRWRSWLPTGPTLRRAALLGTIIYAPLAVSLVRQALASGMGVGQTVAMATVLVTGAAVGFVITLAMPSLAATRRLIRSYLGAPDRSVIRLLARNTAATAGIAALILLVNPAPLLSIPLISTNPLAWPVGLFDYSLLALGQRIRILPLFWTGSAPFYILTSVVGALAAVLPMFGYAVQLVLAWLSQRSRLPVSALGRQVVRLTTLSPIALAAAALVLLLLLVVASISPDLGQRGTLNPGWAHAVRQLKVAGEIGGTKEIEYSSPLPWDWQVVEHPPREQELSVDRAFVLTRTEIRQEQWSAVVRGDPERARAWGLPIYPSILKGSDLPVESVSWCQAVRFLNLWSIERGRPPCYRDEWADPGVPGCELGVEVRRDEEEHCGMRLPTEVEWEMAARLGAGELGVPGLDPAIWRAHLTEHAWTGENAGLHPHPTGNRGEDSLHQSDLFGNVNEWTESCDPTNDEPECASRIFRGGSAWNRWELATPGKRNYNPPDLGTFHVGFRAAYTLAEGLGLP